MSIPKYSTPKKNLLTLPLPQPIQLDSDCLDSSGNFDDHIDSYTINSRIDIVVKINEIPARSEELFDKWKKARKAVKKKKKIDIKELKLVSKKKYEGDILTETAKIFKTQPEHILKTTERFISEIEKSKTFIKRL